MLASVCYEWINQWRSVRPIFIVCAPLRSLRHTSYAVENINVVVVDTKVYSVKPEAFRIRVYACLCVYFSNIKLIEYILNWVHQPVECQYIHTHTHTSRYTLAHRELEKTTTVNSCEHDNYLFDGIHYRSTYFSYYFEIRLGFFPLLNRCFCCCCCCCCRWCMSRIWRLLCIRKQSDGFYFCCFLFASQRIVCACVCFLYSSQSCSLFLRLGFFYGKFPFKSSPHYIAKSFIFFSLFDYKNFPYCKIRRMHLISI